MRLRARQDMTRIDIPSILVGGFLLVLAAVITYDAWHLRPPINDAGIGASTFPFMIAAGLAVLGFLTVKTALETVGPNEEVPNKAPLLFIVGGLVAQIVLLNVAGFSIATGVMFAMTARAFGARPMVLVLPVGIVLAFAAFLAFRYGLELSLPEGPLEKLL